MSKWGIPREKPVKPTVIVENVMMGLMWPLSRSVLRALKPTLVELTSRTRCKCHDEQGQEEDVDNPSVCRSLWSSKICDGRVNHAAQIAKKKRGKCFYELVADLYQCRSV